MLVAWWEAHELEFVGLGVMVIAVCGFALMQWIFSRKDKKK